MRDSGIRLIPIHFLIYLFFTNTGLKYIIKDKKQQLSYFPKNCTAEIVQLHTKNSSFYLLALYTILNLFVRATFKRHMSLRF